MIERDKRLFNCSWRDPSEQVQGAASLVVRPRVSSASKRLLTYSGKDRTIKHMLLLAHLLSLSIHGENSMLTNNSAGTLVINVHVASRMSESRHACHDGFSTVGKETRRQSIV